MVFRELIDFVKDVGMVVFNSRDPVVTTLLLTLALMGPQWLTTYCLVPIEQWHVFEHFSVLPSLEVSHRFQISVDCSIPDHSILLWPIRLDCLRINTPKPTNPNSRQKFYMQPCMHVLTSSKIQNNYN